MSQVIWPNDDKYDATILAAVAKHWSTPVGVYGRGVDTSWCAPFVAFAKAIIAHESQFNPRAFNGTGGDAARGGSYGLMQLSVLTSRAVGFAGAPDELLTPEVNIEYGVSYLADCYRQAATLAGAASAYNGGWRPESGYGRPLPGPDAKYANDAYVRAVMSNYARYVKAMGEVLSSTGATPGIAAYAKPILSVVGAAMAPAGTTSKSGIWTTIAGAAATVLGFLTSQDVLSILPPKVGAIVGAVGGLLTVFGIHLHISNSSSPTK